MSASNCATMTTTATSASTTSTESKAASGGSLVAAVQPGGQHDAGGGDVNREQIYQWCVFALVNFRAMVAPDRARKRWQLGYG